MLTNCKLDPWVYSYLILIIYEMWNKMENIFAEENLFENVVHKKEAISCIPRCVNNIRYVEEKWQKRTVIRMYHKIIPDFLPLLTYVY